MCGHPGSPLACRDCPWQDARTPLHDAASSGITEVVEVLLAKGADVKAKTNVRREGGGREEGEGEREDTSTGR
jgi:ankyrin repeat protein